MKFNEFPELTTLADNDVLLIQEGATLAIKKIKASVLKQYIGVTASIPMPVNGAVKWYRMDDLNVTETTINSIVDKISGNNLISVTSNPTLVSNAINGRSVANFNNCAMKHSQEDYISKHIFIIYRNNVYTFDGYNAYICTRSASSEKVPNSNEQIIVSGCINSNNIYAGGANAGYIDKEIQSINLFTDYTQGVNSKSVGQFHIVESLFSNSVLGAKNLCVGADSYQASWYLKNVDIAEIIIYPFALTETQRTEMYSYFKSYYNLNFL